jgi:hypothetical protein
VTRSGDAAGRSKRRPCSVRERESGREVAAAGVASAAGWWLCGGDPMGFVRSRATGVLRCRFGLARAFLFKKLVDFYENRKN